MTALDDAALLGPQDWSTLRQARAQAQAGKIKVNVELHRDRGRLVNRAFAGGETLGVRPALLALNPTSLRQMAAFCGSILAAAGGAAAGR